jgi:hypothetical protein
MASTSLVRRIRISVKSRRLQAQCLIELGRLRFFMVRKERNVGGAWIARL